MKRIMIAALALVLARGCVTNPQAPSVPGGGLPPRALLGTWRWVESVGGIAGLRLTPPPEKTNVYLEDGTFLAYRGDTLIAMTTYRISKERTIFDTLLADVIHYGEPAAYPDQAFRVEGDSLYLADICYDCFGHLYVRIGEPDPAGLAGTSWRLRAFVGPASPAVEVAEADTITAHFTASHLTGGSSGLCGNEYQARRATGRRCDMLFTSLVSTEMACSQSMYWDYFAALASVRAFELKGSRLLLRYGVDGGHTLVLERQP